MSLCICPFQVLLKGVAFEGIQQQFKGGLIVEVDADILRFYSNSFTFYVNTQNIFFLFMSVSVDDLIGKKVKSKIEVNCSLRSTSTFTFIPIINVERSEKIYIFQLWTQYVCLLVNSYFIAPCSPSHCFFPLIFVCCVIGMSEREEEEKELWIMINSLLIRGSKYDD